MLSESILVGNFAYITELVTMSRYIFTQMLKPKILLIDYESGKQVHSLTNI